MSPGFLLGHTGAMLAAVTIGVIWSRRGNASRSLVALSAAAILTFGAYDRAFSTSPPHAAIAEALRPLLQEASPATPSFVARDHKLLRGYLGRTGVVLSRDSLPGQSPDLRAWVLSPGELADPDLQGPLRALGEGTRPLPSEAATGAGYRLLQRP